MSLKTSIVVNFSGDNADGSLQAEFHDPMNPPSPFRFTDEVYFLVFKGNNVWYNTPIVSSGGVVSQGSIVVTRETELVVTDGEIITLDYLPTGPASYVWWGNTPVLKSSDKGVLTFDPPWPAVGKATYSVQADLWKLVPPVIDDTLKEYGIVIFITGGTT